MCASSCTDCELSSIENVCSGECAPPPRTPAPRRSTTPICRLQRKQIVREHQTEPTSLKECESESSCVRVSQRVSDSKETHLISSRKHGFSWSALVDAIRVGPKTHVSPPCLCGTLCSVECRGLSVTVVVAMAHPRLRCGVTDEIDRDNVCNQLTRD